MDSSALSLHQGRMLRWEHHNGLFTRTIGVRVPQQSRAAATSLNIMAANFKLKRGRKYKRDIEYPWPDKIPADDTTHPFTYINKFKPLTKPRKKVLLPFERPIAEINRKMEEVKKMQKETGLHFERYITLLEIQYNEIMQEIYGSLTPFQRLSVARHPNRPTCLEHVSNISDKWLELHGDRAGYDDPAIVTGIASMDGISFMFIGHQKGRNTKENIYRNFAMPTPHGYRKALRIMHQADHFGLPIITFVDTPGAYADIESERKGQGEAIAQNLRSSFGLQVPFISVVIGEGGSGGALAISTANRMLMLENSVYFVASPEAAAAILYKSAKAAPKAAARLKITAQELCENGIADEVIPEPLGGAHGDPLETSKRMKRAILRHLKELRRMTPQMLIEDRKMKFTNIGGYEEKTLDAASSRNMVKGHIIEDAEDYKVFWDRDFVSLEEAMRKIKDMKMNPEDFKKGSDISQLKIKAIEPEKKPTEEELEMGKRMYLKALRAGEPEEEPSKEEIEIEKQKYLKALKARKQKGLFQKLVDPFTKK